MRRLALAAALALAACSSSPSSDPESSLKTYLRLCQNHDYYAAIRLIPPAMRMNAGQQASEAMTWAWDTVIDFDYEFDKVAVTGDHAIITVRETYVQKNERTRKTATKK